MTGGYLLRWGALKPSVQFIFTSLPSSIDLGPRLLGLSHHTTVVAGKKSSLHLPSLHVAMGTQRRFRPSLDVVAHPQPSVPA